MTSEEDHHEELENIIASREPFATSSRNLSRQIGRRRKKRSKDHTRILSGFDRKKRRRRTTLIHKRVMDSNMVKAPLTPMVRGSKHNNLSFSPMGKITKKNFISRLNLKPGMVNVDNSIEPIMEAPSELEKFSSKNVTLREKDKPLSNRTAEIKYNKKDKISSVRSKLSDFAFPREKTKLLTKHNSLKPEDILEEEFPIDDESRTQKLGTFKREEDLEFESNFVMHASERATYKHVPGDFESRNMKTLAELKNRNITGVEFPRNNNYSRKPSSPNGIGKISFLKDKGSA